MNQTQLDCLSDALLVTIIIAGFAGGAVQIGNDYRRMAAATPRPLAADYEGDRCEREMFAVETCLFESTDCRSYFAELDACRSTH